MIFKQTVSRSSDSYLCMFSLFSYKSFFDLDLFYDYGRGLPFLVPRDGELRTQKLKSHLVRTGSLNVLPLKPGVCQYIAMHATLTARDFFFAYFYPSSPFTCIFFLQNHSRFFPVLAVAVAGSCVGPQNEIGHPAGCRLPC